MRIRLRVRPRLGVLSEYANKTVGLEREPHLVRIARKNLHGVDVHQIETLEDVIKYGQFDLIMTCTVLQHLTDDHARRVLEAVKAAAPNGLALLVEKSGSVPDEGNILRSDGFLSRSRPVVQFQSWMEPFELIAECERRLEASYPVMDGKLMLFASPSRRHA